MTAKEKQTEFIKSYLKPTLKQFDYRTSGQTWWKDKGDFFIVINLQNYSWNSQSNVDFRFNMGIALKANLKDTQKKKVTYSDLASFLNEAFFLPDNRERKFLNELGYSINDETDLIEFATEIKTDLEEYILPGLNDLKSLADCMKFYERDKFWGDHLKKVIQEAGLNSLLNIKDM